MDRKGFLKRVFGAAVVAAMPKVVVDQIESLPPPDPPDTVDIKSQMPEDVPSMYIYDEDHLIGWSNQFSLNRHQDTIESQGKWKKVTIGRKKNGRKKKRWIFVPSKYPKYRLGPISWDIVADRVEWYVDPMTYFENCRQMKCLMFSDTLKVEGEMILTEIEMSIPIDEGVFCAAKFEGSGKLIMEPNENNT